MIGEIGIEHDYLESHNRMLTWMYLLLGEEIL